MCHTHTHAHKHTRKTNKQCLFIISRRFNNKLRPMFIVSIYLLPLQPLQIKLNFVQSYLWWDRFFRAYLFCVVCIANRIMYRMECPNFVQLKQSKSQEFGLKATHLKFIGPSEVDYFLNYKFSQTFVQPAEYVSRSHAQQIPITILKSNRIR